MKSPFWQCYYIQLDIVWENLIKRIKRTVEVLKAENLSLRQFLSVGFEVDAKKIRCPVDSCSKDYTRVDHLHRHIRKTNDAAHSALTSIVDQTHCVKCHISFNKPGVLVRHDRQFHNEHYISRAYLYQEDPSHPRQESCKYSYIWFSRSETHQVCL